MRNGFIVVVWLLLISFGILGWLGQTKYGWWSKTQVAETNLPATKQPSDTKTAEIGTAEKNAADASAVQTEVSQTKAAETKAGDEGSTAEANVSDTSKEAADAAQVDKPAKIESATTSSAAVPSFDIVRVEPDGTAVIAGRAEPGASVSVLVDGKSVVDGKADARGEWAFLVEEPISPGNHNVTLSSEASGKIVMSDQSVAIGLPERADEKPLIVLSKKGEPSKILQAPAKTPTTKPEPQVETQVAAKQLAEPTPAESQSAAGTTTNPAPASVASGASSVALSLKTVDYDDEGNMIFTGTALPKGSVRIYVNNKLIADAMADLSGVWTLRVVKEVQPGNHYLRVDQLTKSSKVASRIELPFTRVDPKRVIAALNSGRLPKVQQPDAGKSTAQGSAAQGSAAQGKNVESAATAPAGGAATSAPTGGDESPGEQLAENVSEPATDKVTASTTETGATSSAVGGASIIEQALSSSSETPVEVSETENAAAMAQVEQEPDARQVAESAVAPETDGDSGNRQIVAVIPPAVPGASSIAQQPQPAAATPGSQGNVVQRVGRVIIQPGNNLWNISRVIYGSGVSYTAIYQANKAQIRDPHLIYPGQIFTTPGVLPPEQIQP